MSIEKGESHILIVIRGGCVEEVLTDTEGVTYDTLDWDKIESGEGGNFEFLPLYTSPTVVPSIEGYMREEEEKHQQDEFRYRKGEKR